MKKQWIVLRSDGNLGPSKSLVLHDLRSAAENEAERLAKATNQTFLIFELIGGKTPATPPIIDVTIE